MLACEIVVCYVEITNYDFNNKAKKNYTDTDGDDIMERKTPIILFRFLRFIPYLLLSKLDIYLVSFVVRNKLWAREFFYVVYAYFL